MIEMQDKQGVTAKKVRVTNKSKNAPPTPTHTVQDHDTRVISWKHPPAQHLITSDASQPMTLVNMARTKKSVNTMKEIKRKASLKRRVFTDPPMGHQNPLAEQEIARKDGPNEDKSPPKKAKTDEVSTGCG